MKMYILIRDDVPVGFAALAAAHASLACYLKYENTPEVKAWVSGVFYKTLCSVTADEFERAKATENHVIITESALGNREVALAFAPREDWPKMFRYLKLFGK